MVAFAKLYAGVWRCSFVLTLFAASELFAHSVDQSKCEDRRQVITNKCENKIIQLKITCKAYGSMVTQYMTTDDMKFNQSVPIGYMGAYSDCTIEVLQVIEKNCGGTVHREYKTLLVQTVDKMDLAKVKIYINIVCNGNSSASLQEVPPPDQADGSLCDITNFVHTTTRQQQIVGTGGGGDDDESLTTPTPFTFTLADPYFEPLTNRNVTVTVGKSVHLPCKVKRLGSKSVSWIRHRDLHILTVGKYLYTSDERFQPLHKDSSDEWFLHIKYAQRRDTGIYECQISTQPIRSIYVYLNVVEPVAEISDTPEMFVSQGSNIFLRCTIKYSPEPPASVKWYHNDRIISYDSPRGGVNVITEKGDITLSYLIIQKAQVTDSGRFYCCPSNARKASILVHVLRAESPAAMQKGSTGIRNSFINAIVIVFCVCFLQCNQDLSL